jgi:hypothetical protein
VRVNSGVGARRRGNDRSPKTSIDLSISPTMRRAITEPAGLPRGANTAPTSITSALGLNGTRSLGE